MYDSALTLDQNYFYRSVFIKIIIYWAWKGFCYIFKNIADSQWEPAAFQALSKALETEKSIRYNNFLWWTVSGGEEKERYRGKDYIMPSFSQ